MDDDKRQGLAQATFSALKWSYAGTVVKAVSQILIGAVLARLLGPEPFGLIAVAWIIIGFGNLVADFGFGAALVQRKTISEEDIRYVFTVQIIAGLGLTLIVAASAGLVSQLFNQNQLIPVIQAISPIFTIQALSQAATNLLRRDLDFKNLRLAEVLSYMISFLLLGIPLAYLGFGVWSLIIAQLSQGLLYAIITYTKVRHSIRPSFIAPMGFFSFGTKVLGTNILNWSIRNMDNVFVGRLFGMTSLGLYSRSYALMAVPMDNIKTVLQSVLFPAYSRAQDNNETLQRVYLASVGIIAIITIPIFGSVAVIPSTLIEGLYGDRWLDAAPLLVPLALSMPFHAIMALAGPLIWGKGRVGQELLVQSIVAILFVLMLLVTSKVSLLALAWGVFTIYLIRFILMTRAVLKLVDASWRKLLLNLRGGASVLIVTAPVVLGMDSAMLYHNIHSLPRLLGDIIVAAGTSFFTLLIFANYLLTAEVAWLFDKFSDRMPQIVRLLLSRAQTARI